LLLAVLSPVATGGLAHASGPGITPVQVIDTVAGTAIPPGLESVAVDAAGNLFIADTINSVIRKEDAVTGAAAIVAGGGNGGDGPATAAKLSFPRDVKLDSAGNIYVADTSANIIRVVNTQSSAITVLGVTIQPGNIQTVAGTGTATYSGDNGPAIGAGLSYPYGIALNAAGSLYIADDGNNAVRKVSASGTITTIVGQGPVFGGFVGDGGSPTSAWLRGPISIALDAAGNLYFADTGNGRIRMVNNQSTALTVFGITIQPGTIQTIAGNGANADTGDGGPATSAAIAFPMGLTADAAGNLYFADLPYQVIRLVNVASGIITRIAGTVGSVGYSGDGGPATSSQLNGPQGTALDAAGNLYIADADNAIRKVSSGSGFPPVPVGQSAPSRNIVFQLNTAMAIQSISVPNSQGGAAEFIVAAITGCIADGQTVNSAGANCIVPVQFKPAYPGVRSLPLMVSDGSGNKYSLGLTGVGLGPQVALLPGLDVTAAGNGNYGFSGDSGLATNAQLYAPSSVAADALGNIYIADTSNHRIRKVDTAGNIATFAGNGTGAFGGDNGSATAAQLNGPAGVAVDAAGNVYIADLGNHRIRKVDAGRTITTIAGNGSAGFSGDAGPAIDAQLNFPHGIAVDSAGNIFIADRGNNRVRKVIAATGVIITVAGTGAQSFSGDNGPAVAASLSLPWNVAVDAAGNLYIADYFNWRVRKVTPAGTITTIAGNGLNSFSGDNGPATSAQLSSPQGLAVDTAGNVYIADSDVEEHIRKVNAATGIITTVAAGFSDPQGLALDSAGNLYVAESGYSRIDRITAAAPLSFPSTPVSFASALQTVTAVNIGNQPLTLSGLAVSADFSQTASGGLDCTSSTSLVPGATCQIAVIFQPGSTGQKTGTVTLTSNAQGSAQIQLSGLATAGQTATSTLLGAAPGNSSVYGQAATFTATVTANGVPVLAGSVSFLDTVSGLPVGMPQSLNVSGQASVTIKTLAAGGHNIEATYNPVGSFLGSVSAAVQFSVSPVTLTVTAQNATSGVGATPPVLTYTISGFVNGDAQAVVSGAPSLTTSATSSSPVGSYPIAVAQGTLSALNYTFTFVNGTLQIAPVVTAVPVISSVVVAGGLLYPGAVALDAAGNIYIADESAGAVRKVNPASGDVTTVANAQSDGATPGSSFNVGDIKLDGAGNVYIADYGLHVIRVVNTQSSAITLFGVTIPPGTLRIVAGTVGASGYAGDNQAATSALLNYPSGIALDGAGNLYIADLFNNVVRRVGTSGIISTVVGQQGSGGFAGDGGPAASAQLKHPISLGFDAAGNLYISDRANYRVRVVNNQSSTITLFGFPIQPGSIQTVAGSSVFSPAGPDGPATLAAMSPNNITVDAAGNFYVSDDSHTVFFVNASTGLIKRVVGTGTPAYSGDGGAATSAQLHGPLGTALDAAGNLYICDSFNRVLRRVSTGAGFPQTAVGQASPSQNILLQLNTALAIQSITVPNSQGGVAEFGVTSTSGCSVNGQTLNTSGAVCTVAVQFNPAFPGWRGWPLVLTDGNGKSYSIGLGGIGLSPQAALLPGTMTTVAGGGASLNNGPATSALLSGAAYLTTDGAGNLYIADYALHRVRKVDPGGTITTLAGTGSPGFSGDGGPAASAQLNTPFSVAADAAGNIYIADGNNNRIRKVDGNGTITTVAGTGTAAVSGDGGLAINATIDRPRLVTVDTAGNLYIADTFSARVREVLASTSVIVTVAGGGTSLGDNGPATSAQFQLPDGLVVDAFGNMFIADSNRVRKVGAGGTITTLAGNGIAGFSGDNGPAVSGQMNSAEGLAVDAAGNLYVVDTGNQRVRKIDTSGIMTTVAGSGTAGFAGDNGSATSAQINNPTDVALDVAGNLFIADLSNARVRKVTASAAPLSFPSTTAGQTSPLQIVTAVNTGNQKLNFTGLSVSADFQQSASGGADCASNTVLAAGASCQVGVVFQPATPGSKTGLATVTGNALNQLGTQQQVQLSGFALTPTSTAISFSGTPTYGQSLTFTAAVTAAGSVVTAGSVSFRDTITSTTLGSPLPLDSNGMASIIATLASGNHVIQATYIPAANFGGSQNSTSVTVNKAILTVTASNAAVAYGFPIPALSATISGLVNGDPPSVVVGSPSLSTTATASSPAGSYPITAALGTLFAANYTFTFVSGTLTVLPPYLVGDIFPYTSNVSGNFGDGQINTVDLLYALRAVTNIPGFLPPTCSDRFDAMDAFPVDTGTVRGGDGVIDTLDLIAILRRVTNIDPSRPTRASRLLPCSVVTTQARRPVTTNPEGILEFGPAGQRTAIYLRALRDITLQGLSLSLSSDIGSGGPALRFISDVQAPSLVDDALPGFLALAWLDGWQAKAGQRVLLGFVESAKPPSLRFVGVSTNAQGTGRAVSIALALKHR
jgi:sugar lactone lactonase YvrE